MKTLLLFDRLLCIPVLEIDKVLWQKYHQNEHKWPTNSLYGSKKQIVPAQWNWIELSVDGITFRSVHVESYFFLDYFFLLALKANTRLAYDFSNRSEAFIFYFSS